MTTVFLIDHPVYRTGLASILHEHPEFQVVGEAARTTEALEKIEELKPDIVIMDVFIEGGEGVEAITVLEQRCPEVKVLILTHSLKNDDCVKAIRVGVKGYLLKSLEPLELIDSIRLVACGSAIVYTSRAARLFDAPEASNKDCKHGINGLSPREKEVLQLVARGVNTKDIAASCYVSQTTIKAHMRRISEKLAAKNRAEAVAKAIEQGLLTQV